MLPMNFDTVLAALAHPDPVEVVDVEGKYVDGIWTEAETGRRVIKAIVLANPPASMEYAPEGDSSNSGITLHTKEQLHFQDAASGPLPHTPPGQSFVNYKGYLFRVSGRGFLSGNTNTNLYTCVRRLP